MSINRFDGTVQNPVGYAMNGVDVYVCTQPANTANIPPSPLATLYTDSTGATPLANPVVTDGNGNFFFYATTGIYTLVYFDPLGRLPTEIFPDQAVVTQGGGSVTSVALTMDGTIYAAVVPGSPITTSGTFTPTLKNENANFILAGPASGGAAAPTFRQLVTADLPSGGGTVTSIAFTCSVPGIFGQSVSGSPLTSSGTIGLTITLNTQTANTFFAGPSSGVAAQPVFRTMVAADLFGTANVTFTATPTFNAGLFAVPTFTMTLTGNVTSSTISNPTAGQMANFVLTQDGVGGHTFAWPTNSKGVTNVDGTANSVSTQTLLYDGTNWRPIGPGFFNGS